MDRVLSPFDYFLIAGIIIANLAYSVLTGHVDIVGSVTGIAGVLCVVLVAKGNIWNYFFGIINVSLYAWLSFKSELYGDAVLNAIYYLPMQFVGIWQWRNRGADKGTSKVRARKLGTSGRVLLLVAVSVLTALTGYALERLGDPQPYKDAATTVMSIAAQLLMVLAFAEQWVLWIATNIISVIMWLILAVQGESQAYLMVLMWIFYLMNSVNGLRIWLKMAGGHSNDMLNSSPA